MKTVIAATSLIALAGILLLMAVGPQAEAEAPETVALSELPVASDAPASGKAETYQRLYSLRLQRIADLEAYAAAEKFPINRTSVEFTPVFVDEQDTPCAVGHLMRCSGAHNLVDQIALNNNLVRLHEITEGPVVDWMLHSGLTKEECELIQPSYRDDWDHNPPDYGAPTPRPRVDHGKGIAQRFIRDHLESTARLLRKNTAASLQVAMARLGGEFEFVSGRGATRVFRNDGTGMLVRASAIDADGRLSPGKWHELAAGHSFSLGAGTLLVEFAPAARP